MLKGEKSTSMQIRVNAEDLATITEFVFNSGLTPDTPPKAISAGITFFAQILVGNKLASSYTFRDAIDFLEKAGFFINIKINKRNFTNQMRSTSVQQRSNVLTPEETKKALELLKHYQDPIVEEECTIPKNDDELLSAMEKGTPNVATDL